MSSREADFTGVAGRAWRRLPSEKGMAIDHFLVHAPASHPIWPWYMVAIVHLRPVEGVPPAHKQFSDASHELMVIAIDPKCYPPDPDLSGDETYPFLQPLNSATQVGALQDGHAKELIELVVRGIVDGRLNPDTDGRMQFEESIRKTAQHFRGEH